MATATDLNIDLLKWENRSFQHALMEQSVSQEEALRRLTEKVEENGRKLDAIIKHLDVPYKPPAASLRSDPGASFATEATQSRRSKRK